MTGQNVIVKYISHLLMAQWLFQELEYSTRNDVHRHAATATFHSILALHLTELPMCYFFGIPAIYTHMEFYVHGGS